MKRITAIASFVLASLISAGSVSAQDHTVRATVPFDFTVGNKLLPSGTYTITSDTPNVIVFQNGGRYLAMSTVYADDNQSTTGKLVFKKYGDQYFLSEILCSPSYMNVQITTSKLEKRARIHEASLRGGDQIFVALK
jgi:hypothetical protein